MYGKGLRTSWHMPIVGPTLLSLVLIRPRYVMLSQVATAASAAAAVAHSRGRSFSNPVQPSAGVNANDLSDALANVELSHGAQ